MIWKHNNDSLPEMGEYYIAYASEVLSNNYCASVYRLGAVSTNC